MERRLLSQVASPEAEPAAAAGCTGSSKEEVENSPFLEKLKRKGYEVIYFTDALDEYVMSNMPEYDGMKFFDASKEDLKIGKDKEEKAKDKKVKVGPLHTPGFPGCTADTL